VVDVSDGMIELKPPCPYCGARFVGPFGLPHFCKELIFQSVPLLRFEQFEVRTAPVVDRARNIEMPRTMWEWPILDGMVRQWELEEVHEVLFGNTVP
jgi:hypothetical protein